jgi:pentapeptide MXKDX repeat protein
MTIIGKVWTAGIAYVALAVGAGLSIMYNVVDTMTVRGPALDVFDVITAVAAPAIVLLMVEMFVSRIWIGQPWHIQVIRWLATLAIGGVAMRTSWTHGHDFMAGRGQSPDVATLWPLAIDLLAIMATALILAGRTRGHVATGPSLGQMATDTMATDTMASSTMATDTMATDTMASSTMATEPGQPYITMVDEDVAVATQPLSPEYAATLTAELDAWGKSEPEPRTFAAKVPDDAVAMIRDWDGLGEPRDFDAHVAAYFGRSARTARRWRSLVTGQPTSGGG